MTKRIAYCFDCSTELGEISEKNKLPRITKNHKKSGCPATNVQELIPVDENGEMEDSLPLDLADIMTD